MEKALGTRLIVCCLEVLPLSPFPFFGLLSNAFPGFGSVGRSVGKEKSQKKRRRSLELGGPVPQHSNMRSLEMTRRDINSNVNSEKKMTEH